MKRLVTLSRSLVTAAAFTLIASSAFAQGGINLSWNDCSTFGVVQKNFACTTNSGTNSMYASAVTGVDLPQLNGMAGVIDLQTNQPSLSNWWQLATGGCRAASPSLISAGFDFTTLSNCLDPWGGAAAGGLDYAPGAPTSSVPAPNRARIRTVCAIPGSTSITGTDEYYFFRVSFTNARTVGNGSCAGCDDGACIVLNLIQVTQPAGVGDFDLTNPLNRAHILWQAGASSVSGGCPAATPTRNRTWGSVKSLYR